jgi:hypothetical protein
MRHGINLVAFKTGGKISKEKATLYAVPMASSASACDEHSTSILTEKPASSRAFLTALVIDPERDMSE